MDVYYWEASRCNFYGSVCFDLIVWFGVYLIIFQLNCEFFCSHNCIIIPEFKRKQLRDETHKQ